MSEADAIPVRLLVAYDGSGFRGFAANPGVRTVAGTIGEALERIFRVPVAFVGAGRTDAGVHAWGQVLSASVPAGTDLDELRRRLNRLCGPEIAIRSIEATGHEFNARFSATSRTYRYHLWNDPVANPLVARYSWHVERPLQLWALRAAADPLVGEHDFSSFCRRPDPDASMVRRVLAIEWTTRTDSPLLRCEISATSFCHQMVRSVVGLMVEVGLGRRTPADVARVLRARDRGAAAPVAPAHGLILWNVGYEGRRWESARER